MDTGVRPFLDALLLACFSPETRRCAEESLGRQDHGVAGRFAADSVQLRGATHRNARPVRLFAGYQTLGTTHRMSSLSQPIEGHDPRAVAAHDHHDPTLQHHFATKEQQFDTSKIGMWLFLATEILMFGGLFAGFTLMQSR